MNITLIGTGNVARHLASAILKTDFELVEIMGRNVLKGEELARKTATDFKPLGSSFAPTDLIVVAVSDDSLESVFQLLPPGVAAVHTAGGAPVVQRQNGPSGVFYPLQTFSQNRPVDWQDLPVLIESQDADLREKLFALADTLGAQARECSAEERLRLHCAAVLVNNMTNHLFAAAEELLEKKNLPFALLHPLMRETVQKAMALSPTEAQTGPAKRGDTATINRHLQLLAEHPETAVLYAILSKHITRKHHG